MKFAVELRHDPEALPKLGLETLNFNDMSRVKGIWSKTNTQIFILHS